MKKEAATKIIFGLILIGLVIVLVNKAKNPTQTIRADKIRVITSIYPLYFLSAAIAGDKAEVTNIVPAGAEPHEYEPTAQDMAKMENSQVVVLNGGDLEAWSEDIGRNIDARRTIFVIAGEGLAAQQTTSDGEAKTDPHVWLAPALMRKMADRIAAGFEQADPENKDYYGANANALKEKLDDLDAAYRTGLADCHKKDIITSHAAFGYLAAAYGFNQVPILGLSPDAEPTLNDLAEIANFAREKEVKYIFFESTARPRLSETIAAEVGAQTLVLDPIEGISDEELSRGKNYFTVAETNLKNLQIALECSK